MIQPGTLVENPLKPEWGPGKVLRLDGAIAVVLFRNAPDGEAKRFKADFLTVAAKQTDPELDAIHLPKAGATGRTRAPARPRKGEPADERSKLAWLGPEGDELYSAFRLVFDPQGEAFGSAALGQGGLSDGNQGVQWNATLVPTSGERRAGVNLEGIKYDGWPIWRLISREIQEPTLPELLEGLDTSGIVIRWERDCWQASSRRAILEREIEPSPVLASELTTETWRELLRGAADCLTPANGTLKRAKRSVTLASNNKQQVADVSPHLMVYLQAPGPVSWLQLMQDARTQLQPIYDWAVERSRARG